MYFWNGIRSFIFYFDYVILEMLQKIINILKIENCKNVHWIVYFWNGIRSFILYFDYVILEMLQKIVKIVFVEGIGNSICILLIFLNYF